MREFGPTDEEIQLAIVSTPPNEYWEEKVDWSGSNSAPGANAENLAGTESLLVLLAVAQTVKSHPEAFSDIDKEKIQRILAERMPS